MMVDRQVQPAETAYLTAGKTVSSAGIPIYQEGSAIFSQGGFPANSRLENAAFVQGSGEQGNGLRNMPPIVSSTPLPSGTTMPPYAAGTLEPQYPMPQIETPEVVGFPTSSNPPNYYPQPSSGSPQGSPVVSSGSIYQSPVSQAPGANNYFAQPVYDQYSGQYNPQSQCGGPTADTGCTSCGPGGCYDPTAVENQFGCSGSVPNAAYYLMVEVMALSRYDGDIQASSFFSLDDFGWEPGGRVTIGYRKNATMGRELTYYGTFKDVQQSVTITDPQNRLGAVFTPFSSNPNSLKSGFGAAELGSFFNANLQTQTKASEFHSLEYNRVKWGYDVIKTQVGLRYIYFDDAFSFFSDNGNTNGTFNMHSINNLFGGSVGGELFYDVGYRASVSVWNTWGGYINLADFDTLLANNGLVALDKNVKVSHVASSIELGAMGHYQLNPRVRLRLGFEITWLWGLYTVNNNFPRVTDNPFINAVDEPNVVYPGTGSNLNTNASPVIWDGISFGMEIFR